MGKGYVHNVHEWIAGSQSGEHDAGESAFALAFVDAAKEAKSQELTTITLHARQHPLHGSSTSVFTLTVGADAAPHNVEEAVRDRIVDAIGESGFSGVFRVFFRDPDDSKNVLGTYQRTFRLAIVAKDASGRETTMPDHRHLYASLVEPHATTTLDALRLVVEMAKSTNDLATQLGNAIAWRDAPKPSEGGGGVFDALMPQVLGTLAGSNSDAAPAARVAAQALPHFHSTPTEPFPTLAMPTPRPMPTAIKPPAELTDRSSPADASASRSVNDQDVEAWARANPQKAQALAMRLYQEQMK